METELNVYERSEIAYYIRKDIEEDCATLTVSELAAKNRILHQVRNNQIQESGIPYILHLLYWKNGKATTMLKLRKKCLNSSNCSQGSCSGCPAMF